MQLIYCYIEEYKALKNAGIHFDNRYECSVEKNGEQYELTINKAENFEALQKVNDFVWGDSNISSISAIVGDNGAGKTTVLEVIGKYFRVGWNVKSQKPVFFLCIHENEFLIYVNGIDLKYVTSNLDSENVCIYEVISEEIPAKRHMYISYFTNLLDSRNYYNIGEENMLLENHMSSILSIMGHEDYSVGNLLYEAIDRKSLDKFQDIPLQFFRAEIKHQFEYLIKSKEREFLRTNLVVPKAKFIVLEMTNLGMDFWFKVGKIGKKEDRDIFRFKSILEKINLNLCDFKSIFFYNLIILFFHEFSLKIGDYKLLASIIRGTVTTIKEREVESEVLLNLLIKQYNDVALKKIKCKSKKDFIIKYKNITDIFNETKDILFVQETSTNAVIVDINNDTLEYFVKFYGIIEEYSDIHFIILKWQGLSTGEQNLLNLFSKLIKIEGYNHLILLDEPDNTKHPSWQVNLLQIIVDFFNTVFEKKVQIIFTTHSPIMLSDIHQSNVVYMKNQNDEIIIEKSSEHSETFAQNIHELFKDAFFLQNTRGTLANNVLDRIEKMLSDEEAWQQQEQCFKTEEELEEALKKIDKQRLIKSTKLKELERQEKELKQKQELKEKLEKLRPKRQADLHELEPVIDHIGEPVLRNFYKERLLRLQDKFESDSLGAVKQAYDKLTNEEKKKFIEHLLQEADDD
ncbi:AAA family ATPase [Caryophanon latum]|uniref:ATPase AAA-type core domain-containing protein n=1 Tax=Caryophanon latum TaxID=33977 RepID=A0A1C0YV83_9BACL|nr:AAA family ATPase [Caryophanon latum]OCS91058.1 hypothetical protein A6K76_09955 [Caryophanon latum]